MQLTQVSTQAGLLSKPYSLQSGYALTPSGLERLELVPGTTVFVSRSDIPLISKPAQIQEGAAEKSLQLKDLFGAASGGGVAPVALQMYQLGNTTSQTEIAKFLVTNNFAPKAADQLADTLLSIAKSELGKAGFIGVAGGAVCFSLLELVKPKWSLRRKLAWSLVVVLILALLFLVLKYLGIMALGSARAFPV